jgi:hypothetical protein
MIQSIDSDLVSDNQKWNYVLSLLDATSQNQYTRTTERYLEFCSIAGLIKENAESVEKFLIYCKDPQEACRNKEELAFGVLLPKEPMAAKTLWTVLSHIKKFFVACQNKPHDLC